MLSKVTITDSEVMEEYFDRLDERDLQQRKHALLM